jgi:hypothetical protein
MSKELQDTLDRMSEAAQTVLDEILNEINLATCQHRHT